MHNNDSTNNVNICTMLKQAYIASVVQIQ